MSQPDLQPTLTGPTVIVRPIAAADWSELFAAASDPGIWKVHPRSDRYTEPAFRLFFDSAVESKMCIRDSVGTILTMTMLIFTALSVTREIERGTMESLLAMPITPLEIMLGKIAPYVLVGFVQASLIIGIGIALFGVPLMGSLLLLALLSTLFITANLAIGYTFSTLAQNQLQAMQMSLMFRCV